MLAGLYVCDEYVVFVRLCIHGLSIVNMGRIYYSIIYTPVFISLVEMPLPTSSGTITTIY